jgi:competence protein ComEA
MLRRYEQLILGLLSGLLVTGLLLVIARRPAGHPVVLPLAPTAQPVRVHVTGAVVAPGVYNLPRGAIWQDALTAASGPSPQADLSHVNLARLLTDGDQILIPSLTSPPLPAPTSGASAGAATMTAPPGTADHRININTASASALDALPGIGPAMAQRIVDYRTAHGLFVVPEDLMQVSGIGPATFDKLKDFITLGP